MEKLPLNLPDSEYIEQDFRSSRAENDRKQLLRIFGLAAILFLGFIGLDTLANSKETHFLIMIGTRVLGLAAAITCLFRIRSSYLCERDEKFVFGCAVAIIGHFVAYNFIKHDDLIAIVGWDITAIFAIYSLTPLSIIFRATLALLVSFGTLVLWVMVAVPLLPPVEIIITPIAYATANYLGIYFSLNLNKIQRQEFKSLAKEKKLSRDLEQTMETRDQLFSVIAHDLRSPIGAICQIGKLLNSPNPLELEERESLIKLLRVGSQASYDLLENLLSWALSETGKITPDLKPVDASKAIEDTIQLFVVSAENKKIAIEMDDSHRVTIKADHNMLSTILRNLIGNAIKFTEQGGRIKISQTTEASGYASIIVSDTGIGMDENLQSNLFNLAFNKTSRGTNGEQGSNLGLRICSDFTLKQGGTIHVESMLKKGTIVTLRFPLAAVS